MGKIRTPKHCLPGPESAADQLFVGDDEMQALLRTWDWSDTGLGPVSTWPAELVAAVRTVLPSRVPVLLWWGPDLLQLYNDAFRVLLADKHPAAIGQPAAQCWAEVWDRFGPMATAVLAGSGATSLKDQLLLVTRSGRQEETYWTYSHSPITDEQGKIRGLFVAGNEVTAQVVTARRLATIRALSDKSISDAGTAADACAAAVEVLSHDRASVPFAAAFLTEDSADSRSAGSALGSAVGVVAGTCLRLAGSYGLGSGPGGALAPLIAIDGTTALGRVATTGVSEVVFGLAGRVSPGMIEVSPLGPDFPDEAMIVPLFVSGQDRPAGVLVLGLSPYRSLDAYYRAVLELLAREVSVLVSDARAYQAQRAQAVGMAEAELRQTEFYQNLSHELRTPLALIQGPLHDLLADDAVVLPQRHQEGMLAADRSAAQLRRLVDTLLQFARVEGGMLRAEPEPTDLALLTIDLVAMFRSAAESNGLHLDADIAPLDRPADVDRGMWSTIVGNLLSNAVKFTTEGAIAVRLTSRDGHVQLTVTDTGPGIPEAQLPLLFNRFHLVPTRSGRRRRQGAGIGLSLAADLVRAHGGDITVTSRIGFGSTFTVTLPCNVFPASPTLARALDAHAGDIRTMVEDAMPPTQPVGIPAQRTEPKVGPGLGGVILIVEDNDDMRAYLARVLIDGGWQVRAVADVDQALAVTFVPDIVLADVMLPERSGLELVRVMRATAALAGVPVVLLTARAGPERAAEGLAAGADDYVTKPFQAEELLARIQVHYELSKLRSYALDQAQSDVANLHVALASNRRIGQAMGILMADRQITEEQAFGLLRDASQHTNRKLRDIADEVIHTGALG